jgi:hypothetical protein
VVNKISISSNSSVIIPNEINMARRPDSAVAMQNMAIKQLQDECKEWEKKFCDAKDEVHQLAGARSRAARIARFQGTGTDTSKATPVNTEASLVQMLRTQIQQLKLLREEESTQHYMLQTKYDMRATAIDDLSAELSDMRQRLHAAEAELEAVEELTTQVPTLEEEINYLTNLHVGIDCAEFSRVSIEKVAEALRMQKAAEVGVEALPHLQKQVTLLEQQNTYSQKQLLDALRDGRTATADARTATAEAAKLQRKVDHECTVNTMHDFHMRDLERALAMYKPTTSLSAQVASTVNSSSSAITIVINITPSEKTNMSYLKRVKTAFAIAVEPKLKITGDKAVVDDFTAGMDLAAAKLADLTASSSYWRDVAQQNAAKADKVTAELIAHSDCTVFAHRNLVDELEAKDTLLQIQAGLVAQWQGKLARVSEFIDKANEEMRKTGVKDV